MEDAMRRTRTEQSQWFSPRLDKDDKRPGLGSGALHFIRNRGSMRRQLMRDSNRAKRPEEQPPRVDSAGSSGGFGKWLKEHLKGSSAKSVHDTVGVDNSSTLTTTPLKTRGLNSSSVSGNSEKVMSRGIYTPQNVYCSLPREHRRHSHDSGKSNNDPSSPRERSSRSGSCHAREKTSRDVTGIARGGVYGSEGKSSRRKNREKRRHSMNETREHRSHRRKSCVPNGGAACSAMTELQPSPAGYRGQDEVPGPPTHPVGFAKSYSSHGHLETCNYSIPGYLTQQQHIGNKQQPQSGSRGSSPGDNYRSRKSDRWSSENDSNLGDSAIGSKAITSYNEGYSKKNTPGYKNDSGYSESIGFDSYSLPFNEADEASPPPTPPVRDASSLKGVCCGPGHEKYPSWPSTASEHHHHHQHYPDNEIDSPSADVECSQSGSHRSKSWTDDTNYPKEKPVQYSRPLAKRPNPTFTQQLKTVMERCEKIPTENYESRGSRSSLEEDQTRLWPRVDRESKSLGPTDPEYVVASSPSERDQHQHQHQQQQQQQKQSPQTLSHADLEAYVRNYHDPQVSQVDIYRETTLTQAGLEEYTRVQHSQQASYAQSEGYHSYVSSVDSTTNTPFLDRLRRDSEAVAQRAAPSWEETSREGRDSVVTTSSGGSASSSETLKWHGSMSDVSVSSGLPTRQVNGGDGWPHGSMSDVSSVNGVVTSGIKKHHDSDHDKWQGSMSDVSSSLMISTKLRHSNNINNSNGNSNNNVNMNNNDSKWQENKWQATMNDRNCKQISGRTSLPSVISHYASVNDVCQASSVRDGGKWQESSIDEETHDKSKGIQRGWESCINVDQARYNHNSRPMPQSSMSQSQLQHQHHQQQSQPQQHGSDDWNPLHGSMSDVSQANISIHASSKQLIAHSARVQTPQRHHSESVLYLDRERTLRKLYPVSTTSQPRDEPGQTRISPVSPQQTHLSVAERINELEKQQMRYTYLDPEKRHRVSDPTLKAIQKKALLSYYERHHQSSWRSEPQLAQGVVIPAQSPPPQPPPRPRPPSSRRASSASDYASISWRDKANGSSRNHNELPGPKHQHSNSCGSLSTDLLGPVIVGPAISIDDWVPERPPKKPHLRAVFNDRVPSPDLPPPSPPTVTESEVLNCDEPLPPPPPPLGEPDRNLDAAGIKETDQHEEIKRHRSQIEPGSTRRSKHSKRSSDSNNKSSAVTSPVSSPTKNNPKQQHTDEHHPFIRAGPLKPSDAGEFTCDNPSLGGYATHRIITTGRSSLRYPAAQKLVVNSRVAASAGSSTTGPGSGSGPAAAKRISEERNNLSRPPARLPDLVSTRYSSSGICDSGNQRPALQVPVESRIIRQESMRVESTRVDASGLVKIDDNRLLESSTGQRPQPQVPKTTGLDKTSYVSQQPRPNYLPLSDIKNNNNSNNNNNKYSDALGYSVGTAVKTSYEANAKLLAEGSPQKYHEPPKYVANRHGDGTMRNYYVLPSKYTDSSIQSAQQCTDRFATSPSSPPPPLAPRQNTCLRKSLPAPPRPAPPHSVQGSQSKASYLAYKRERGAPDSEGSYKRTMSPTARLEDWPPPRDRDDPVLLRVTPHHPLHNNNNHINNNNNNHNNNNNKNNSSHNELAKSHSVDALHHRIEERTNAHSVEVLGKLSHELSKKLQASDTRPRSESNNNSILNNNNNNNSNINNSNSNNNNNNNINEDRLHRQIDKRDLKERVSPQSVQVLNDRNRQLERERRKLAGNCETIGEPELLNSETKNGMEDFYIERSATIEMTSRNVELLNRRNILPEKRHSTTGTTTEIDNDNSLSSTSTSTSTSSSPFADKSPPTTSPRFTKLHKNDQVQLRSRGAVPRRSGSCSSSSSSRSSLDQGLTHSRSSPSKIYSNSNSLQSRSEHRKSLPELENVKETYPSPRSKVSSPAQTESSWIKLGGSQTENLFMSRLRRSPSSGSRSSSLSSASKISSSSSSLSPRYSPVEGKVASPCVSPQPGIEGLTLVQRTEVILRVNTTTMDVASQTEALDEEEPAKEINQSPMIAEPRRKLPEEIECEKLSRDLANQLGPNDKLVPILVPVPELKKPTDYVSGLFRVETTLQPRPRRLVSMESTAISTATENGTEDDRKNEMPSTPNIPSNNSNNNNNSEQSSPSSPTSTYLTTSEGKARFLTQYSQDIADVKVTNGVDTPQSNDIDLKQKKEELVMRLNRKVVVLKAEQEAVKEEGELNETLGAKVASRISAVARPAEASKYRLHVEEVGKITSLLLGLSGRLARAENALHGMPADHSERKILEAKRDKLLEQLEEAKILKSNIDKRSVNVSAILSKYLNDEEFLDYQHFINMKTKLIMDGREIQDKVKLGEEQLAALKEAIG